MTYRTVGPRILANNESLIKAETKTHSGRDKRTERLVIIGKLQKYSFITYLTLHTTRKITETWKDKTSKL